MKKTITQKKIEFLNLKTEKLLSFSDNYVQQLSNIFRNAPAAIAIFNGHDHRFIMANLKYQLQNSRSEKDLLGKTFQEVFPELYGTSWYDIFDTVFKTGETFSASEYPILINSKNNGIPEMCYFNFSLEALINESDEIYGVMIMALDITKQVLANKKIEKSEHRYHEMFMNSPFAFSIMKGKEMKITLANKLIKEFWGKGNNVEGKTLLEVLPELINQPFPDMIDSVYRTGVPVYANEMLAKLNRNGKMEDRYFNIVYEPLLEANKTISGVITIAHEVTQQVLARKKIEESEHKYQNLIYTSPYMIAIFKGKNLIIEIANDAILETWGKGKDIIGKSFFDILPEAVEQGFDKLILKVFETGEPYHAYETPITLWRNEHWQLMHYNFIYQAQRNMQGNIEGVAILANEVTPQVQDKMKIIESEERFRLLADNLPVSIFIADATLEDNITYVNKYWLDFTKQTFDIATNNGWFVNLHPDDKQLVMNIYEPAFKKHEPYIIPNFRLKRHDGEYRWFTFQATPRYLPNGEFEGYMGAGFDITELKLFELEIIEQKIKAENAVQAKQQFLSNMSHEIRTPMNAIVGFTNVILKTELNDSQKQYLDAIKVSGDALVVLINDILDLAKVDAGKMTFEKIAFNLAECIHKIVLIFEIKLKEKKLQFNLKLDDAIPNQIIGDPMRLRQIILNLLSNAIKFTDKGSISLDVKVLSQSKNKLNIEFKITDTGIGVANDKLESIFNNFEQAHAETSANYGGTGLGLAIVKKLVENQGGTITIKSEIHKGSSFLFTLEFNTNNLQNHVPNNIARKDMICQSDVVLKNIKILVAEDVVLNQLLIKIILEDLNFEVDIADNGKIAIEKIKTDHYDLVFMDLHMPEMNGFEATKYIREEMKSQIPIIALTADVTQVDIDKCLDIGMHDYISKPIDEALLYEKIVKVLNDN